MTQSSGGEEPEEFDAFSDIPVVEDAAVTEPSEVMESVAPDGGVGGDESAEGSGLILLHDGRVRLPEDIEDYVFVSIITVPRVEVPEKFSQDRVAIDLPAKESGAADVKKVVTATLPDEQLTELYTREIDIAKQRGGKERGVAMKAIRAEMNRRDGGYPEWVAEAASNPLTARVAAIAIANGSGEGMELTACANPDRDEMVILEEFWTAITEERTGLTLCCFDLACLGPFVGVRSVALNLSQRRSHYTPRVEARQFTETHVDVFEMASALGIDVPEQPTASKIFDAYRSKDVPALSGFVGDKLDLERSVILASRTV